MSNFFENPIAVSHTHGVHGFPSRRSGHNAQTSNQRCRSDADVSSIGNFMSNNFSCLTAAGAKITVWRLSFDHQATSAITFWLRCALKEQCQHELTH